MPFQRVVISGALLLGAAQPLLAQKAGAVEFGGFGRFSHFDTHLAFDDRLGVGGRLGIFVLRNLALEGEASYTLTSSAAQDRIQAIPLHGRLVYNIAFGGHSALLLGGGYTRQLFRDSYRETRSGAGGLLGLRLGTGELLSIRLDATGDYIPNAESSAPQLASISPTKSNWHWGGQVGLSLIFGGRRDGDRDKDGIRDSADQCPATPARERVDATGCPLPKDADGDGVTDNLDRCPSTPAGTVVDATGCPRDSDGDGVLDAQDQCGNTPAGTPVDGHGCPRDSDGDGVQDGRDKCPNTPAGTTVDANGCPRDSDHDGVIDTLDRCPNTPAGETVDQAGCPVDSDHDGVLNAADRCPDTAAGARVDAVGCPALFTEPGRALVLQGVNFATGKATLLPESQVVLDRVAESLNNNPGVNVEVGGHTDNTGRRLTNMRLSQARAITVRDFLISKGVDGSRITARGYGPDQPAAENTTATGRAANRRVELTRPSS